MIELLHNSITDADGSCSIASLSAFWQISDVNYQEAKNQKNLWK